jgi:transcriptional regulator with XRE-family HTH domain
MNRLQGLGLAIRDSRRQLDLTQEQLAEKCGVHLNFVSRVERGLSSPSLKLLFLLSDGLNIPASQLLARAEEIWSQ